MGIRVIRSEKIVESQQVWIESNIDCICRFHPCKQFMFLISLVRREMNFREAGKNPINSIQVHPSGNRLLVHVRNSAIRIVDLGSLLTLYTLTGLVNDK